jgi:hypothetical protein
LLVEEAVVVLSLAVVTQSLENLEEVVKVPVVLRVVLWEKVVQGMEEIIRVAPELDFSPMGGFLLEMVECTVVRVVLLDLFPSSMVVQEGHKVLIMVQVVLEVELVVVTTVAEVAVATPVVVVDQVMATVVAVGVLTTQEILLHRALEIQEMAI